MGHATACGRRMAAWALLGLLALGAASAVRAAETEGIGNLTSPREIQAFRENYIEEFQRIGLNTTPGDAMLLRILIQGCNAKRGIEVGTATGYGAIVMGLAFERTGGHLYTLDIDAEMVKKAREHVANMGLEKTVTVIEGDALEVIPKMEGTFDFLFLDAHKPDYFKYFKAALPMLKPGAMIVADNSVRFREQMSDFLEFVETDPDYDAVTIMASEEKGDGMTVVYKAK